MYRISQGERVETVATLDDVRDICCELIPAQHEIGIPRRERLIEGIQFLGEQGGTVGDITIARG